jgi:hypothetical protein
MWGVLHRLPPCEARAKDHDGAPPPRDELRGLLHRPPPCQAKVKERLKAELNAPSLGGEAPRCAPWLPTSPTAPRFRITGRSGPRGTFRPHSVNMRRRCRLLTFARQGPDHGETPPQPDRMRGRLHRSPTGQAKVKERLEAERSTASPDRQALLAAPCLPTPSTTCRFHITGRSGRGGTLRPDRAGGRRLHRLLTFACQGPDHGGNPPPPRDRMRGRLHRWPLCQADVRKRLSAGRDIPVPEGQALVGWPWLPTTAPTCECRAISCSGLCGGLRPYPAAGPRLDGLLTVVRRTGHRDGVRPRARTWMDGRPPPSAALSSHADQAPDGKAGQEGARRPEATRSSERAGAARAVEVRVRPPDRIRPVCPPWCALAPSLLLGADPAGAGSARATGRAFALWAVQGLLHRPQVRSRPSPAAWGRRP